MNTTEYMRAKFEFADILRAAVAIARARQPELLYPFEDLFARLAEDRFNIAVVGQFSRGKTSLMNAMLNTKRLPMGVVPLTSVITTVQYGTEERAVIEYAERRLPHAIALDELSDFVTQRSNPGNEKGIRLARVELQAEILRQGFYLIDTPGLGSAIAENTRTTEDFLPEADAFIVVTSYDSPLSNDEIRLLEGLGASGCRAFLVINKMDLVSAQERGEVEEHVHRQLGGLAGGGTVEVFSVSARDAMAANASADAERRVASGLRPFIERLIRFLVDEKKTEFLRRMFERADAQLAQFEECREDRGRLIELRRSLEATATLPPEPASAQGQAVPRFTCCAVCRPVERGVRQFLQKFQYRITVERDVQSALHAQGGLCPFHTWQYDAMASPHGTCVAFPGVLEKLARDVDSARTTAHRSPPETITAGLRANGRCALCEVHDKAERTAIADVVAHISRDSGGAQQMLPDICLPHLSGVLALLDDVAGKGLLAATAEAWRRTAEDMRRYALKRDGSRRAFTTKDEIDADKRGLRALAGHASISFVRQQQR